MQTDPTTTHRLTTAAVPERAAEVTMNVPQMQAEIKRLREQIDQLLFLAVGRSIHLAELGQKVADLQAENCRLTCRNGDMEMELRGLKAEARNVIVSAIPHNDGLAVSSYWLDRLAEAVHAKPKEPR